MGFGFFVAVYDVVLFVAFVASLIAAIYLFFRRLSRRDGKRRGLMGLACLAISLLILLLLITTQHG